MHQEEGLHRVTSFLPHHLVAGVGAGVDEIVQEAGMCEYVNKTN